GSRPRTPGAEPRQRHEFRSFLERGGKPCKAPARWWGDGGQAPGTAPLCGEPRVPAHVGRGFWGKFPTLRQCRGWTAAGAHGASPPRSPVQIPPSAFGKIP
uniref:Uncharacterized protein n=1 Tax=Dromaius novaehollandiae TaxID=8790 RepID=A0A8C4KKY6_DRONO